MYMHVLGVFIIVTVTENTTKYKIPGTCTCRRTKQWRKCASYIINGTGLISTLLGSKAALSSNNYINNAFMNYITSWLYSGICKSRLRGV